MVRVSIAIQAHPRRAEMASALAERVGGEVVFDPDPEGYASPWRTHRHLLELTPPWATHRLALQDDSLPCKGFAPLATLAISHRPHSLIAFFVAGRPPEHVRAIRAACDADESWALLDNNRWCPAVALAWPVELIEPICAYVDSQNWPEEFRADDEIIGRFLRVHGLNALATVPSLVEHPDETPSLLGRGRNFAGEDIGRVAACLIDVETCDPLTIDWSLGPADSPVFAAISEPSPV